MAFHSSALLLETIGVRLVRRGCGIHYAIATNRLKRACSMIRMHRFAVVAMFLGGKLAVFAAAYMKSL